MKYQQLTPGERYTISQCRKNGMSKADIAKFLGRSPSTISRELSRNCHAHGGYSYTRAQQYANGRRSNSRKKSHFTESDWNTVKAAIREDWSPEQVSLVYGLFGILKISTETIYKRIWQDKKNGGDLHTHLRHATKQRYKRYKSKDSRGVLAGKRPLSERPKDAEERTSKGHFEIDLVHCNEHTDCILTLVDRKTRFTFIRKMDNKSNSEVARVLIPLINQFDIKTISADNGTEWHGYKEIESKTNCLFYFAKPYHSWERGTNENMNGLIRQYYPKKRSMRGLTQEECDAIAEKLNRRPRKILNLSCPETCHFGIPLKLHF